MKKIFNVLRTALLKVCSGKTFRIMKLTNLLLWVTIFNVFGSKAYSQYARLNLDMKDVSIQTVLSAIEGQSEFFFLYSSKMIDVTQKVDIQTENKNITEVLDNLLAKTDIKYVVRDRQILLINKEAEAVMALQQSRVTGIVTDKDGAPMPGVNVLVKGTTLGALTDVMGKYSLEVPNTSIRLQFSFIGYVTQEVALGGQTTLNVVMTSDVAQLSEVVVIGYGTQLKKDLTGSISSISTNRLLDKPAFNIAEALGGKIAGVKVIERSGAPGGTPMIRIRGTNSIYSNNDPLFVVDGIVGVSNAMTILNPNEIESMDVLKDASATAIYGARGANGVIIITTKRGVRNGMEIEYNGYVEVGTFQKHTPALTTDQFMYVYEQGWANVLKYTSNPDRTKDFRGPYATGLSYSEMPWLFEKVNKGDYLLNLIGKDGNYYAPRFYTNWETATTHNSVSINHQISIRGGNDKSRFGLFLGYSDNEGLLKKSYFRRYTGKLNSDVNVFKWLDISTSLTFQDGKESIQETGNTFRTIMEVWPVLPLKYPNDPAIYGTYADKNSHTGDFPAGEALWASPVWVIDKTDNFNYPRQITGSTILNFKLTKDLSFKSNFGIDYYFTTNDYYYGKVQPNVGNARIINQITNYWQNENYLNYVKQIGPHNITGLLGLSWSKYMYRSNQMTNSYYFDDFYKYHNIGVGTAPRPGVTSNDGINALNSYFARVNYSYKSKYLLTITTRIDGSSKFGLNTKYGLFPSASVAWKLSEEDFMKNSASVSNLKLRMSAGQTGNQEIGSYVTQTFLGSTSSLVFGDAAVTGLYQSTVGNSDLRWEKNTQYDGGIDLGLFEDRIAMNFDYYYKLTTDMLLDVPLPTSTTPGTVKKNYGNVENKGIEVLLSTHNIKSKNFNWYTNLTFSRNKNVIVNLGPSGADIFRNNFTSLPSTVLRVGESVGTYWGLTRLGTYSIAETALAARYGLLPGDIKYEDKNNDGVINIITDGGVIGSAFPAWEGSISNNMIYRNFDFNIDIKFAYGNSKETMLIATGEDRQLVASGRNSILDGWRPDHQNTMVPQMRPCSGNAYYQQFPDTHWVEDASFIRGESATLGYSLPASVSNKIWVKKLRVFIAAKNFFVLTKFTGYDPEASSTMDAITPGIDFYMYPRPTTYSLGVNVIF